MTAFARAAAAILADPNLGVEAIYEPPGGPAVTIRAARAAPDRTTDWNAGQLWSDTVRYRVAVADVAAPAAGDRITVAGEVRIVQGEPLRDVERLTWALDTRPAPVNPASTFPMTFPITLA